MLNLIEINGEVVHGNGKGKTVGMPTANIAYDKSQTFVQCGVYATEVLIYTEDDAGSIVTKKYIGVTNIGTRPSVDEKTAISIETHILDFNEDIYGKTIKLRLLEKIRDVIKFKNLMEVKQQVDKDKVIAREIYNKR